VYLDGPYFLINDHLDHIVATLDEHKALQKLSPDDRLDVVEQVIGSYHALLTSDRNCRAQDVTAIMVTWSEKEAAATPARLAAFKAVIEVMHGTFAICNKHQLYSQGVQHFKAAVQLAKAAQDTQYAIPGLVQLCWARAAECFWFKQQLPGAIMCAEKAWRRLGDAIDPRGVYLLSFLLAHRSAELEAKVQPSWRTGLAKDQTGRLLRCIGWVYCGRSYCSMECAFARFTLVGWFVIYTTFCVLPWHSWCPMMFSGSCHGDFHGHTNNVTPQPRMLTGVASMQGVLRKQVVPASC
jgi:hypothetical protein